MFSSRNENSYEFRIGIEKAEVFIGESNYRDLDYTNTLICNIINERFFDDFDR